MGVLTRKNHALHPFSKGGRFAPKNAVHFSGTPRRLRFGNGGFLTRKNLVLCGKYNHTVCHIFISQKTLSPDHRSADDLPFEKGRKENPLFYTLFQKRAWFFGVCDKKWGFLIRKSLLYAINITPLGIVLSREKPSPSLRSGHSPFWQRAQNRPITPFFKRGLDFSECATKNGGF